MLNNSDLWPITCPQCGKVIEEQIGRLKGATSLSCPSGHKFGFSNDNFSQYVEELRKSIANVARNSRFTED
jgi:hypothetical protein